MPSPRLLPYPPGCRSSSRSSSDDGSGSSSSPWIRPNVDPAAGCNPSRASASRISIGAKARAILAGRYSATVEDVKALARPVLRHRVLPNFTAESEGITSGKLVDQIVERVKG